MAKHWRIRHKLLLGLGLVLGTIGVLLTGTLEGLSSYVNTMKIFDNRLAELDDATEFQNSITELVDPVRDATSIDEEAAQLRIRVDQSREKLAAYEKRLDDAIERRRESDYGVHEKALVKEVLNAFIQFDQVIDKALKQPTIIAENDSKPLINEPAIKMAAKKLSGIANEIRKAIYDDQYRRIATAKSQSNRSMAIAIATAAIGVLITMMCLRFFYGWLLHPLNQLQQGVRCVAGGSFDGKIELKSGDEFEELADAFNEMTSRLHVKYSDLTNQVTERGQQLVRSERLAGVGFLAAGVAHEINNPLASIAFCGEALERRLGDLLARLPAEQEAVGKYLKMIQQEAFRCKAITQNLLEFSRVGEGERTPADLAEVVQSVLEMSQHLKASENKQVIFRTTARLVAKVNPQEIKQVVLNLVVNAMESMDEGGTLTITLAPKGQGAEIIFADTGCGMPADVLENIFEPFFTRSRTGKGTGLGLSISQRIVTQHGGEIEASSNGQGSGSVFVVRLPLAPIAVKEASIGRVAA